MGVGRGRWGWRVGGGLSICENGTHSKLNISPTKARKADGKLKKGMEGRGGWKGGGGGMMGRGYVDFRDPGVGGRCPVL